MGVRRPFAQIPQQCPPSPAGPLSLEALSPQRHQPSSWALQSAKGEEIFLAEQYQPHRAFVQESNGSHFRTQPAAGRREKRGWAASGSLGPLFAGGLWSLKPTPNVFSFAGKHDWVCEGLLRKHPNNAPRAQLGRSAPKPRLPNGTNRAPGGCSLKGDRNRPSGAHTSPNGPKLRKATKAVFAPSPPLAVRQRGAGLPLAP